ncbi:RcnB family protein [Sphingobium sp. AN641]|uniref:RcnB family protein n=1 Tax=Sphingobium sp. AN641 TaxID=3133443 RepID=UPI0030C0D9EF
MFKKILMALTTTALVASPIVTAQAQAAPHDRQVSRTVVKQDNRGRTVVRQRTTVRNDRHYRDTGRRAVSQHRWAKGQRFDRRQANNYRVINNYRGYRLSAPPRGYQWVQSGNDAVMIALATGIIGAVIGGAIR